MRILHTSDWHLGRALLGRSRLPEQKDFLQEICDLAQDQAVDLVLVAGDVFDSGNPSAEAENLFYTALERLAAGGQRAAVVIAGNHDSPERLRAASPLAERLGISLLGYPAEELRPSSEGCPVQRVACGPGWMELALPSGERIVIVTLAYPSEARLGELLSRSLATNELKEAYSARVGQALAAASTNFRSDTVNLVVGHIYVMGGRESESERDIHLGGALAVEPSALPTTAQYVALGHLHRPQAVGAAPVPARYAGSPLAYSFSEVDQQKEVVLVDVEPGTVANVRRVPLASGLPLKSWSADSLEDFFAWAGDERNQHAWVDLEVKVQELLSPAEMARIHRAHPRIVQVRPVLPEAAAQVKRAQRTALPLREQFRLFAARELGGEPSADLIELFLELVNLEPDQEGKEVEA